jgi:hypothetical protein
MVAMSSNGPIEFPVPGAAPQLPEVDPAVATVNYHDEIVPPAYDGIGTVDSGTWLGWGMLIGTAAGVITGLIVGIVSGVINRSTDVGATVAMFGLLIGGGVGWVYGTVVGLLEAIANVWAQRMPAGRARIVHGAVGLAPLVMLIWWPAPPFSIALAIAPAVGGAISGALFAGRYRRLRTLYAEQRSERAALGALSNEPSAGLGPSR